MQGTPASRRMAHTKTASNSEATTSITARSLTPESIAERASRPSSGCPGRHVVSNTSRPGKRARRRHASEITKRGRTKDRTGSHALAARGSLGCDAARLPRGSIMTLSAWMRTAAFCEESPGWSDRLRREARWSKGARSQLRRARDASIVLGGSSRLSFTLTCRIARTSQRIVSSPRPSCGTPVWRSAVSV